MRVVGEVERVRGISREEFERDYVAQDRPVIIQGALDEWPARSGWTPEGLVERIGRERTRFKVSPSHRHPDFSESDLKKVFASREGTFADLIAELQGGSSVSHVLLTGEEEPLIRRRSGEPERRNDKLSALFRDFSLPPLFDAERLYSSWFWVSGAGVRTWLHYDNNGCHNLNAQVQGQKRVWLIPPDQLGRAYPFPLDGLFPAYNCCRVDFEQPDPVAYPGFEGVNGLHGEVHAGDLFFLPANWIHTFLHVGAFNVNVNFWWKPPWIRHSIVSARQALIDACSPLGGVQALSLEARKYLAQVERQLLAQEPGSGLPRPEEPAQPG